MKKPDPTKPAKKEPRENAIELPKDFEDPKIDTDETFEAVAEIRKEKDGTYCVVSLDGVPMDAESDEPKDEEETEADDDGESESIGAGAKKMMGGY